MRKQAKDFLYGVIRGWELCEVHLQMGVNILDGKEIAYMMSERGVWAIEHPDVSSNWRLGFKTGYKLRGESAQNGKAR